jgi:hypothetical protein
MKIKCVESVLDYIVVGKTYEASRLDDSDLAVIWDENGDTYIADIHESGSKGMKFEIIPEEEELTSTGRIVGAQHLVTTDQLIKVIELLASVSPQAREPYFTTLLNEMVRRATGSGEPKRDERALLRVTAPANAESGLYIEHGKVYDVTKLIMDDGLTVTGGYIQTSIGEACIKFKGCAHLKGLDWTVVK